MGTGKTLMVAPHAGARIETNQQGIAGFGGIVAPHAGARIETPNVFNSLMTKSVAPHAGARIETFRRLAGVAHVARRSPCGSAN